MHIFLYIQRVVLYDGPHCLFALGDVNHFAQSNVIHNNRTDSEKKYSTTVYG